MGRIALLILLSILIGAGTFEYLVPLLFPEYRDDTAMLFMCLFSTMSGIFGNEIDRLQRKIEKLENESGVINS